MTDVQILRDGELVTLTGDEADVFRASIPEMPETPSAITDPVEKLAAILAAHPEILALVPGE